MDTDAALAHLSAHLSAQLLRGRPVPPALAALVRHHLAGGPLLRAPAFAGLRLLERREGPWLRRYLQASPLRAAASYAAIFEEIGFFLLHDRGDLLGLWFGAGPASSTPVVLLDGRTGRFSALGDDLPEALVRFAHHTMAYQDLLAVEVAWQGVVAWCEQHGLRAPRHWEELLDGPGEPEAPHRRFEAIWDALP